MQNDTKLTYQDPAKGSAALLSAPSVEGKVQVTVNAPGGMPIQRPRRRPPSRHLQGQLSGQARDRPRFDVTYSLPAADKFAARILIRESRLAWSPRPP